MKKLILTLFLAVAFAVVSVAQSVSVHAGIGGGATFDSFDKWDPQAGWHVGPSVMLRLPMYFTVQPSVFFSQNYGSVSVLDKVQVQQCRLRQNQLFIPLAVQWGPDLGIIRPFIQVVPFVNVNLDARTRSMNVPDAEWVKMTDQVRRAMFGTGVGAGLDIWKFQLNIRYDWRFGSCLNPVADTPIQDPGRSRAIVFTAIFFMN